MNLKQNKLQYLDFNFVQGSVKLKELCLNRNLFGGNYAPLNFTNLNYINLNHVFSC